MIVVDVTLVDTGMRKSHCIDRSPTGLDEEARQNSHQRLAGLKIHPRDALPNRTLTARLERAWMQCLGDEREQIGTWLSDFSQVLATQQSSLIASQRQQLNEALDALNL